MIYFAIHVRISKSETKQADPIDDIGTVYQRACLGNAWSINLLDNLIGIIDKIHVVY